MRLVTPELLDSLPEDAPSAIRSRRDLRIINRLLGSASWMRRALSGRVQAGEHIVEIGAGDGSLGLSLMESRLARITPANVAGLDVAGRPLRWPEQARWFQTSVFQFPDWAGYPVVIGNLIFHHFNEAELGELGARLGRHARLIVAGEPLRTRRTARLFSAVCPLIGADAVTRHDGRVSIEAGFRGNELPEMLGLDAGRWSWRVDETWLGAYRLIAERRAR